MTRSHFAASTALALLGAVPGGWFVHAAHAAGPGIGQIDNVVVIFAENRSFDNLYGHFPGANGIDQASPRASRSATATAPCWPSCRRSGTG